MKGYKYNRILILGDSGRGKSTFAERLSKKIGIPCYSTDDFYFKVKFSVVNDKEKSVEEISHIYKQDEWIVEGTTRRLILEGLERADVIYLLKFRNIVSQYFSLIKRNIMRKNESISGLFQLLKHVTYKKYKKGYGGSIPSLESILEPYKDKIIMLDSIKEMDRYLESIG